MIPALFVFHNDTCDTMTLDRRYIYVCSSSVTTVITVTTVIEKSDRAVTIGTIKIGAVLSYLAYLRIEDEKLFAADNIFLSASIFAHKVGFAVHYFALATVGRSGASIALWHPPALCGRSLCTQAGEPAPLILSAKGENSWRENRPSE
jgi:hypothetical protein